MNKLLNISLVIIYLLANTELRQLSGVPGLFKHFHQHQKAIPALDFLSFLEMHYIGDDGNAADDEEDARLPFKNPQSITIVLSLLSAQQNITYCRAACYVLKNLLFYTGTMSIQAVPLDALLRPPILVSC